ncbi:MAG: alginate export family protein [Planctomycetes bacterium]|nr:alginate export family protein [Planctomycetota bacterium]
MRCALVICATASVVLSAHAQNPESGGDTQSAITIPGVQQLTVNGEYWLRFEDRIGYDFGSGTFDDDFFTQRARLSLDFRIDEDRRVFVQLQDARFWGEETNGTVARTSPGFDAHQAFLEVDDVGLVGGRSQIGRQILSYGEQRLVGGLEWLSQGRAFDAVRHSWTSREDRRWQIDLFGAQLSEMVATRNIEDDAMFFGAYATIDTDDDGSVVDVYVLYRQNDDTPGGGNENRYTLGARTIQHVGAAELGAELATQGGDVNDADIPIGETYAAHAHAKVGLGDEHESFVRAEFDIASGDDPGTADVERFDNLYPTAHMHLGIMDFALWENILHGAVAFGTRPTESSSLTVAWHLFRSMEETDRVAGPAGSLTMGGAGFSNDLGNEIDVVWHQNLPGGSGKWSSFVEAGYGMFLPGDGVEDSFGSDDLAHYVYVQGGLKF